MLVGQQTAVLRGEATRQHPQGPGPLVALVGQERGWGRPSLPYPLVLGEGGRGPPPQYRFCRSFQFYVLK